MNPNPIETAENADLRGSLPAMQRAAQRAREIAVQTGTVVVVRRNGALEHLYPQPEPANQRMQEPPGKYGDPI